VEEQELGEVLPVAEQLGKDDRQEPDRRQDRGRRGEAAPVGRADPISPRDRANETDPRPMNGEAMIAQR